MIVIVALGLGVLVGGLLVVGLHEGRWARRAQSGALAAVLLLVGVDQFSAAFDGYDTDLWTYVLITERVADGISLLDREPFLLQPPPTPHLSVPWVALGWIGRATGLDGHTLARGLALVSGLLLLFAAWRLASRLFGEPGLRRAAVLLFWLALYPGWAALPLGRTMSLAFVLLAVAEGLGRGWEWRRSLKAAAWIASAFYVHLFGGVLALAGLALAAVARDDRVSDRLRSVLWPAALSAVLALPCLIYALSTSGLVRSRAHVVRPGQGELLGLLYLQPVEILHLVPISVLALLLVGLLVPAPPRWRAAQRLARAGTVVTALVLFTPLYHLAVRALGGWLPERFVFLAFPWVAATLAVGILARADRAPLRAAVVLLVLLLPVQATLKVARDLRDRPLSPRALLDGGDDARVGAGPRGSRLFFRMSDDARAEARRLRPLMHGRVFVSDPLLAYGVTAETLGRPLAVPPGHASPFGDFQARHRRVRAAFAVNSPECWAGLFADYDDLEFLLTPAAGAEVERSVWARPVEPQAVRRVFAQRRALRPVFEGRFFVLDAIEAPDVTARSCS
jgi:hypothetical protein